MKISDYAKAQGWLKRHASSENSAGEWEKYVALNTTPELDVAIKTINDKFGPGTVFPASEAPIPPMTDQQAIMEWEKRNRKAGGGRIGFNEGLSVAEKEALADMKKIENITEETLNKFRKIVDGLNIKENKILGENVKHLPQDVTVQKLQKYDGIPAGYKRPRITNAIFKMILNERGIKTYDNYRTEKIVKVLNNHLDKNKGNILSIKPSAAAELLPEFKVKTGKTALGASQGGEGNSILKTYRNFISGGERIGQRSGISVPETIGGKPVSEIVTELDQNFLDVAGGRARGNFTVFEETKLLDQLANENPKVKALELKGLYEEAGGTNFKQRLLGLIPAKTGSGYTKESVRKGGINILEKVQEGVISNSLPESLKSAFKTYGSGYNHSRFLAEADKFRKSNPELAYRFVNAANIVAGKARRIGLTGAGEHALPVSAIKTANAPVETLLQIDAYVDPQINNWKAKNFDEAIFSPNNGLAVQYKKATGEKKLAIQKEIMERFEFIKAKAPELMKNVKLDFTDGKFTASSTTKPIDQLSEIELKQLGTRGETIKNFFIKEMPDALTIDPNSGRITNINDSFINRNINQLTGGDAKLNKFVMQNMAPSGFAGAYELLSDDLKRFVDTPEFKTFSKYAAPAIKYGKLPAKLYGWGDFVLGGLDFANNKSKGMDNERAAKEALDMMLFGATEFGEKELDNRIKATAKKYGINEDRYERLKRMNKNQKEVQELVSDFAAQAAQSQELIDSGMGSESMEHPILEKKKKAGQQKLKNLMAQIIEDSGTLATNLRIEKIGGPIQAAFDPKAVDISKEQGEAFKSLSNAAYEVINKELTAPGVIEQQAKQLNPTWGKEYEDLIMGASPHQQMAYDWVRERMPRKSVYVKETDTKPGFWKSEGLPPSPLKMRHLLNKFQKEDQKLGEYYNVSRGLLTGNERANIAALTEADYYYPEYNLGIMQALKNLKEE